MTTAMSVEGGGEVSPTMGGEGRGEEEGGEGRGGEGRREELVGSVIR